MKRYPLFLLAVLACLTAAAQPSDPPAHPARFDVTRPEIASFINEVAERDGLQAREVRKLLREARPQPKILDAMNRPIEKIAPWWEYRARFVTPERIDDGVRFWADHKESLERAAATYQVPPEYIVAILGVETQYGRVTGSYRVLDALATLAFDYPPRQKFFRSELEQFLILTREYKLDPPIISHSHHRSLGSLSKYPA